MIRLQRYPTAASFLVEAGPFLEEAEAENNIILGIARELAANRGEPPALPPYFATVRDGGRFLLCAFRSVPGKLGVTRCERADVWALLAEEVPDQCPDVAAVLGPEPGVTHFAELLAAQTGRRASPKMRQRIHQLMDIAPLPDPPAGTLRPATPDDREVVVPWVAGFLRDVGEPGDPHAIARSRIDAGQLFLWDHDGPVSMAAWAGKTANGVRVNFVYTPETLRGRGYATACVTALSRRLLAEGNRFCCLYTDLANPTSNAIYRRIGYFPVCDAGYHALVA